MSEFTIAMIGGGMMAQIGHIPFYAHDPRCQVAAICESRPSLVEALRTRWPEIPVVADHRQVLADPKIDAVVISAPRPATGPLTLEALQAKKQVVAEKPMAHTLDQAQRLVDAARSMDRGYHIGFMKRYDGGIQAAKTLVDELRHSGAFGDLLSARFYDYSAEYAVQPPAHTRPQESRSVRFPVWPTAPDWLDAGYHPAYAWFMNAISHDLNLLRFFMGNDLEVESAFCPEASSIVAVLRHDKVAITLEAAKTAAGRWIEGAEFLFEKGRVAVEIPSPMAVDQTSKIAVDSRTGQLPDVPPIISGWSFERQAQAFVTALTQDQPSLSTGQDSLQDMQLAHHIWQHINQRGMA